MAAVEASTPADVDRLFADALSRGDLDGAVGLYEPDAVFVRDNGHIARGHTEIRAVLAELIESNATLDCYEIDVVENGDLAVLRTDWIFTGTNDEGERFEARGRSIEVVRRQPNGTWLFTVDLPSGATPHTDTSA